MTFDLRCTRHDLMRVAEGHPVTLENNIRLRLYTASEFVEAVKQSQEAIGMPEEARRLPDAAQLEALTDGV